MDACIEQCSIQRAISAVVYDSKKKLRYFARIESRIVRVMIEGQDLKLHDLNLKGYDQTRGTRSDRVLSPFLELLYVIILYGPMGATPQSVWSRRVFNHHSLGDTWRSGTNVD